jgi:hypothetical protein
VIRLVKLACKCWAKCEKTGKLAAFKFLRRVMEVGKLDQLTILKMLYLAYARHTKRFTWDCFESIRTMRITFIDLLGINAGASY